MNNSTQGRSYALRLTGASLGAFLIGAVLVAAPAQAAGVVIDDLHVDQTQTRSAGHNVFLEDGVRVYTDNATSQAKAAGYFAVDKTLASAGEPVMDVQNNPGGSNLLPSTQLVVDFDNDTKPDGILVGEPTYADGSALYGDNWWLSNGSAQFVKDRAPSHGGGFGSDNNGKLDDWRTEFPDAKVLQAGWSLGSGVKGDVTIYTISLGSTEYLFARNENHTTKKLYSADVDQSETRSAGHNVFRETSGVRVYTDDASSEAKAAGYFAAVTPLADAGEPSMSYRRTSGLAPSVQLKTDFDNDGTVDGILVGETVYGNDWWLSNGSKQFVKDGAPAHGGGFGSDNHGTLSGWRMAFPDAKIFQGGWSLGSGAKGDGVINNFEIGNTTYTFTGKNRAPMADPVNGTVALGKTVTIPLKGTDLDKDDLTYTAIASHGTAVIKGSDLEFTPEAKYVGPATFDYVVNDGRGGTASAAVNVSVTKAVPTMTLAARTTIYKNTWVYTTVKAPDAVVDGATVTVKEGSTTRGTGRLVDGFVEIKVGSKISRGTHTYTVFYPGTSTTTAVNKKVSVVIK